MARQACHQSIAWQCLCYLEMLVQASRSVIHIFLQCTSENHVSNFIYEMVSEHFVSIVDNLVLPTLSSLLVHLEQKKNLWYSPSFSVNNHRTSFVFLWPPEGGQGCLISPPCLESQGCHLIPLYYLFSCFSAVSYTHLTLPTIRCV